MAGKDMCLKFWQVLLLISQGIAFCKPHPCPEATEKVEGPNAFDAILKENSKYEKYADDRLFELDMKRHISETKAGKDDGQGAKRRKEDLWSDGIIPYVIGPSLRRNKDYTKKIENAMKEYHDHTCIRFKRRRNEADYVEIEYGDGCESDVGRIGGRQTTSLGGGCYRHGIIVHELGHVVGFQHEQNRPDREQYVKINYENIRERFKYAFNKFSRRWIDSRGVKYDYRSVMHYGAFDFTKNGKRTIKSFDPKVSYFGNNHLSKLDIKQINLMYECAGKVPDFPDDFQWRTNGRNANDICTLITEDREPSTTGWDDNFLCQRKNKQNIGIRWSQRGPIRDMRCTKIDMPGKPSRYSWNDNYLCVPTDCFYKFEWSTTGPVSGADCLRIEEPNDRYMNGKKFYLCAKSKKIDGKWSEWSPWTKCSMPCGGGLQRRTRSCDNPRPAHGGRFCSGDSREAQRCNQYTCSDWPTFPADFVYGTYRSTPKGKICIRTYERLQYSRWNDKLLCIRGGTRDLGLRWSDRRALQGMRCVKVDEPKEYRRGTWDNNYLCLPKDSPFEFQWSHNGPIKGLPCLQWYANRGRYGWDNNFLCGMKMPRNESKWSAWTPWSVCSKTCGTGHQVRNRTCSKAPGSNSTCEGKSTEARLCKIEDCNLESRWSAWTPWSVCSKTCGTGHQVRNRTCSKAPGSNSTCEGTSTEVRLCKIEDCNLACGGHIKGNNGTIVSLLYPKNTVCLWYITAEEGRNIDVIFDELDITPSRRCRLDYVELRRFFGRRSKRMGRECGKKAGEVFHTRTNRIRIKLKVRSTNRGKGFALRWTANNVQSIKALNG